MEEFGRVVLRLLRGLAATMVMVLWAPHATAEGQIAPKIEGAWLTPVGESVYSCEGVAKAWIVKANRTILSLVDGNGIEIRSWPQFSRPIFDVAPSHECSTAWLRFRSAPRIAVIQENESEVASWDPDPKFNPPEREVHAPIVLGRGESAWVCWEDHKTINLLRKKGASLSAQRVALKAPCSEFTSWERSEATESAWLIPNDKGLCIAHSTGAVSPYDELRNVNITAVDSRDNGRVAVAIPSKNETADTDEANNGLYVVDANGKVVSGKSRLLKGHNVLRVRGSTEGRMLWIKTDKALLHAELVNVSGGWSINSTSEVMFPSTSDFKRLTGLHVQNDNELWLAFDDDHPTVWSRLASVRWEPPSKLTVSSYPFGFGIRSFRGGKVAGSAWYRSAQNNIVHAQREDHGLKEVSFDTRWLPIDDYTVATDDKIWLRSTPTSYLAGLPDAKTTAVLTLRSNGLSRPFDSGAMDADVDAIGGVGITWPGSTAWRQDDVDVDISVSSADGRLRRSARSKNPTPTGAELLSLAEFSAGDHVTIEARVRHLGRFDTLVARWDKVPIIRSPWRRYLPWLLAASLLLIPMLAMASVLERRHAARKWLPLLIPAVEATVLKLTNAKVDLIVFAYTTLLVGVLALALGLLAPRTFRGLGFFVPFSWVNTALLSIGAIRSRVLRDFAREAADRVENTRADVRLLPNDVGEYSKTTHETAERGESYVSLPARLSVLSAPASPTQWQDHPTKDDQLAPAPWIVKVLQRRSLEGPVHFLVEAPGGQGKSALLREVIYLLVAEWRKDARTPLPIVIPETLTKTIYAAALDVLASYGLDPLASEKLLGIGSFVLIGENLNDGSGALTQDFLSSGGRHVPIVVAARPTPFGRKPYTESAARCVLVQPRPLLGEVRKLFVKKLLPAASEQELAEFEVAAARIGSDREGFSPLLLKLLAVIGTRETVDSAGAVFARACELIIGRRATPAGTTLQSQTALAEKLAFDNFWQHGQRIFLPADSVDPRHLEHLVSCGLLRSTGHIGHVQFFHDSMCSFLAARKAMKDHVAHLRLRAAGNETYEPANAELLRMILLECQIASGKAGAAERAAVVRKLLADEILAWRHANLTPTQIWAARLPDAAAGSAAVRAPATPPVLDVAVLAARVVGDACKSDESQDGFAAMEGLYLKLAPTVWRAALASSAT